jgi:menaquinone-9 beta-reductase
VHTDAAERGALPHHPDARAPRTRATARDVDVAIIGAGPAGLSTALHLVRADPAWAERVVLLDRAVHPRPKPCAGGVTHLAMEVLTGLGLDDLPPHARVRAARMDFEDLSYAFHGDPVLRVFERSAFDAWLVRHARRRGLAVEERATVRDVRPGVEATEIRTDTTRYRARMVVVADGANSPTRRALAWPEVAPIACLIETTVAAAPPPERSGADADDVAWFDFTALPEGLAGYAWRFPSRRGNVPVTNVGVYDSRARGRRAPLDLARALRAALPAGTSPAQLERPVGSTLRWYSHRAALARPGVLLAGDAAGSDPLFGEGIAFALAYGRVAALAIVDAERRRDLGFDRYAGMVRHDPVLRHLNERARLAPIAYAAFPASVSRMGWRAVGWGVRFTRWRASARRAA